MSTLKYFRAEYEAHIKERRCPANVCEGMKSAYVIDESICIGCTACTRVCPVDAISGERKKPHSIDPDVCIACGACAENVRFPPLHRVSRKLRKGVSFDEQNHLNYR